MKINGSIMNSTSITNLKDATASLSDSGFAPSDNYSASIILDSDNIYPYFMDQFNDVEYEIEHTLPFLRDKFILITSDEIPMRNFNIFKSKTHKMMGIIKVSHDGNRYQIMWGFSGGNTPSKFLIQHLIAHNAMIRRDNEHRVVINISPIYFQHFTYIFKGNDETKYSYTLWDSFPDLARTIPDGIGLVDGIISPSKEAEKVFEEKFNTYNVLAFRYENVIIGAKRWSDAISIANTLERASQAAITINQGDDFYNKASYFEKMALNLGLNLNSKVLKHGIVKKEK